MVVIGLPATAAKSRHARACRLVVDEHRAGAAVPFAAAELAAGKAEFITKDGQEVVARLTFDGIGPTVDLEGVTRHGGILSGNEMQEQKT